MGLARTVCPLCTGDVSEETGGVRMECSQCDAFLAHTVCLDQYLAHHSRSANSYNVAIGKFDCPMGHGALRLKESCKGSIMKLSVAFNPPANAGPRHLQQHPRQQHHHAAAAYKKAGQQQPVQSVARTHQFQRRVELPPARQGVADLVAKVEAPAFVPGAEFVEPKPAAKPRRARKANSAPAETAAHTLQRQQVAAYAAAAQQQQRPSAPPAELVQQGQGGWVTDPSQYRVRLAAMGLDSADDLESEGEEEEGAEEWASELALMEAMSGGSSSPTSSPGNCEFREEETAAAAVEQVEDPFTSALAVALAGEPAADGLYYFTVAGVQYLYDPKEAQQAAPANAPTPPPPTLITDALPVYTAYSDSSSSAATAAAAPAVTQLLPLGLAHLQPKAQPAVAHLPSGPNLLYNGAGILPQLHTAMGIQQQQQPQLPPALAHLMKPKLAVVAAAPKAAEADEQEELSDLLELLGVHA